MLVPDIFHNVLFSDPLGPFLNMRDQVFHQHKTAGKIIIPYILILAPLSLCQTIRHITLKPVSATSPEFNLLLICLRILLGYSCFAPSQLNFAFFLGAFAKLRKATISFVSTCLSVRPSVWNTLASNGRNFMEFNIWVIVENLSRCFKFH
jgi:hypothetical protein